MLGKTEDALRMSERMLMVAPFDREARWQRVSHLWWARQFHSALEEFKRAREIWPDFHSPSFALPRLYWALGRHEEAHHELIVTFKRCGSSCDMAREALQKGWEKAGLEGGLRAWLRFVEHEPGSGHRFGTLNIATAYVLLD